MRFFYLLLFCYCFHTSCITPDTIFPREDTLTQELMPLQGTTYPIRVEVKHPFLIIQNIKRTDSLFHIYNLTNNELKSAFGVIGQGPGDFVHPWLLHTQLSNFLISDSKCVNWFNINENGQPKFEYSKLPGYINARYDPVFISDSLYVIDAMYLGPDLYLFNLLDELPKKTWKYRNPSIRDYYIDPNMGNVYANENRIAFCYGYKKQIDFFDIELNLIKRVKFKYNCPSKINGEDDKVSYTYGYFGKNYLYVLFFGTSWNEHRYLNSHRGTFLEVFDLDGNPVARYNFDGIIPIYFAVDEETFTLYGAGDNGYPEDYLLVYKLKGLS